MASKNSKNSKTASKKRKISESTKSSASVESTGSKRSKASITGRKIYALPQKDIKFLFALVTAEEKSDLKLAREGLKHVLSLKNDEERHIETVRTLNKLILKVTKGQQTLRSMLKTTKFDENLRDRVEKTLVPHLILTFQDVLNKEKEAKDRN